MSNATFQLSAGHLALDFANTLDNRYIPERQAELLPSYDQFLAFAKQAGILNDAQARALLAATNPRHARLALDRIISLREALYRLFLAAATSGRPPAPDLETLNAALTEARAQKVIGWEAKSFVWRLRGQADKPDGPAWQIAEAAAQLLASEDCHRIRECSEATCRWLFLDKSKNRSRRWCNMEVCGNRAKARRFHARHRSELPGQ